MNTNAKRITFTAVLTALEIILSRFLSINAWNIKIGFNFIPVVLAALLLGPVWAGLVAALGDLIGAILFPIGAYFPGFTISAFMTGIIFGLLLFEKQTVLRTVIAVLINQLIISLLVNSAWICVVYGSPYLPLIPARLVQCAILIPVQIIVIIVIQKFWLSRLKQVMA